MTDVLADKELNVSSVRASVAQATTPLVSSLVRGIIGGWALVLVQLVLVVFASAGRLSSVWEVQVGGLGLLPAWWGVALVPGACGGLLAHFLPKIAAGDPRARWAVSAGVLAFFLAVGWGIGGGRHLADLSARAGFALCLGLVTAGGAYGVLPWIARFVRPHAPRFGLRAGLLAASGVLAVEALNLFVLVRLYPAFHAALSFLAFALCGWLMAALLARGIGARGTRAEVISVLVLALLCVVTLTPASRAVAGFDNFRWVVSERSPTLSLGVELAAWAAPPPQLDESLANVPLGQRQSGAGMDLRGRDILLISIDALRADHVGAYGYKRNTTPEIDRLAETAAVFEAAYAPTPHTSYSLTSLMTGKYMRPLLLQGAGEDSALFSELMQAYEYRTAAFYPPAVFFIDPARFQRFQSEKLGFEYAKVEFAEGDLRVSQYQHYLSSLEAGLRVFSWVHLFGPHEPYEAQEGFDFGKRDIDLYDSEVRASDETVRRIVELARKRDPKAVVLITADHGEEFGDHGGRYHGSTVYDEQVRVPLIIDIPGVTDGRRIAEPVQTIDLLPTVLSGLGIPIPPRVRGRDLSGLVLGKDAGKGRAVAETDDYTLFAEGSFRLICQRRSGACQLFDISSDPRQLVDISSERPDIASEMRASARAFSETHGKYESQGLRAEGKGWPAPILLGLSGDAEVAPTLAHLLDDADPAIRRKAAELLFDLGTLAQAPALRLAMTREEDAESRAWIALSLTRLGQGAPLVQELLRGPDLKLSRLAALALAEQGNDEGADVLVSWWADRGEVDHDMARRILSALAKVGSKDAVSVLVGSMKDVRLRPFIAQTLGDIGSKDALPHLAAALVRERYRSARLPLAEAIVKLGGDDELIVPLRRFLGVPERLEGGLALAERAGILEDVGGPKPQELKRLAQLSDSGVQVSVVVAPGPAGAPVRLVVRARSKNGAGGEILVERSWARISLKDDEVRVRKQPEISRLTSIKIALAESPPGSGEEPTFQELDVELPQAFGAKPGHHLSLDVFAPHHIELAALAAVPIREDLPPPPPEPWAETGEGSRQAPPEKPGDSQPNPSP